MAYLLGQSKQIDSMMVEKNKELVTDSHTIKQSIDQYIQAERQHQQHQQQVQQPVAGGYVAQLPSAPVEYINTPNPHVVNTPPNLPVQDNQLEFNLTPNQGDVIINLLKEISTKLTKQNNILEKIHAKDSLKEEPISVPTEKSVKNK
jgi:hypothetical protein